MDFDEMANMKSKNEYSKDNNSAFIISLNEYT